MRMLFDFEGGEVLAVMKLISERMELLIEQSSSPEHTMEIYTLGRFTEKLGPVIQAGMAEEKAELLAWLN